MNAKSDIEKVPSLIFTQVLNDNDQQKCEYILNCNKDLDFSVINDCFEYDQNYPLKNSPEAALILETYILLKLLEEKGITENNYANKKKVFDYAIQSINEIVLKDISVIMPPKPSQVTYALKYFLLTHYQYEKAIVKNIIDIITDKTIGKDTSTRLPKSNPALDAKISNLQEFKIHLFNTTEGFAKFQFYGLSIFDLPDLAPHRSSVYKK